LLSFLVKEWSDVGGHCGKVAIDVALLQLQFTLTNHLEDLSGVLVAGQAEGNVFRDALCLLEKFLAVETAEITNSLQMTIFHLYLGAKFAVEL
jgi:hypothetical protein